jgi:hypothetical protein
MAAGVNSQAEADAEEVMRLVSEGKRVTDPELRRRIDERADAIRRQMLQTHGLTNIAAELTVRDERRSHWMRSLVRSAS